MSPLIHICHLSQFYPHPDHDERHEQEEEGHHEAEPVHGEVADRVRALDLEFEIRN